jgi:energy-coupling factor transporter ATP-binding protein EcfA2
VKRPYQIIFLNGPQGVGKSTLAVAMQSALKRRSLDYMIGAHADPLTRACISLLFQEDPWINLKDGAIKSAPIPGFEHVRTLGSPDSVGQRFDRQYVLRDFMIALGHFVRKELGADALSRILCWAIQANEQYYTGAIIEGVRTPEDIEFIRDFIGAEHCLLLRIHRPGHGFERDLGGYVEQPGCAAFDINNDASLDELLNTAMEKFDAEG